MVTWEPAPDVRPCPHCGSTSTELTLEVLGLTRYACRVCRRTFALDARRAAATKTTSASELPSTPDATPLRQVS